MAGVSRDAEEQLRRLRWQCRRGMLELDHLLSRFLDLGFADLSKDGRELFTRLLREQDQDLHNWLIACSAEPPAELRDLIAHVRSVASESSA